MGQEILYCYKCQGKVLGTDFAGGKAFQVGHQVSCSSCAADLLQTLDHREREQLLSKMFKATQDRHAHSSGTPPSMGGATSSGHKNLKVSTVRLSPPPEVSKPSRGAPLAPVAIGALLLVGVIVAVVVSMNGSEPTKRETPAVAAARPAPPAASAAPALSPAETAARDAIRAARDFAARNPKDLEGQIAPWRRAAELSTPTPFLPEARREMEAALGRCTEAIARDWAELDKKVESELAAQKHQAALNLLQSARSRYSSSEWTLALDRRMGELDQAAARRAPSPPPTPPPAPAETRPPDPARTPLPPAEAKWESVLGRASMRDYAGALEELKGGAPADLEALRLAASVLQESQDLLARWPKGQTLAVDAPDRIEGVLLRGDASRLGIKQAAGTVWVDVGDITPGSLAELFRGRAAKKSDDDRAAALFCLLEGEVDAAQKILGEKRDRIAEKFWSYGAKLAQLRRSPEVAAKESEARELWRASADGLVDYTRTAPSVEQCRMLLRDYAGTGFVARNRAAIATRAGGGKEYLFCADNLKPTGAWKSVKATKSEICWTCEKEGPGNSIELSYTALAASEYHCWVYVGGCCQETFAFSAEGTDLPLRPIKNSIVGLKKTHSMHNGPKLPAQWAWIQIPLPKDTGAGVKTLRLVPEQQGFSVAYAAVTLQKDPPRDSDMREFERLWKDLTGGTRGTQAPAPAARPGKVVLTHDFSKGPGPFSAYGGSTMEIVDADPGVKAIAVSAKGVSLDGFQVTAKPTTIVRFRVKALIDLDYFECTSWIKARSSNAWYHVKDLKKGEWRVVEFKMGDMQLNWAGPPIMGESVVNILFSFVNRPDDARVLLTDFELRD